MMETKHTDIWTAMAQLGHITGHSSEFLIVPVYTASQVISTLSHDTTITMFKPCVRPALMSKLSVGDQHVNVGNK